MVLFQQASRRTLLWMLVMIIFVMKCLYYKYRYYTVQFNYIEDVNAVGPLNRPNSSPHPNFVELKMNMGKAYTKASFFLFLLKM